MPTPTRRVPATAAEWRCPRCRKLLGLIRGNHLHIRFAQGHEYLVALPATCTCRGCRTLSTTA
jgi:hypothetical protein